MFYPEFEKIKDYKEKFNLIPVSISLFADMDTPFQHLRSWRPKNSVSF